MASRRSATQVNHELRDARRQLTAAALLLSCHRKVCWDCYRAGRDAAMLCEEGWLLIKLETRWRSAACNLTSEPSLDELQGTLW